MKPIWGPVHHARVFASSLIANQSAPDRQLRYPNTHKKDQIERSNQGIRSNPPTKSERRSLSSYQGLLHRNLQSMHTTTPNESAESYWEWKSPRQQPPPMNHNGTKNGNKNGGTSVPRQHGVKGVYYGGHWLDIEDCDGVFNNPENCSGCTYAPQGTITCPRSRSRNVASTENTYDVIIVGAGCIGAAVARELSRYSLKVLLVEAADDVTQGATKGNSGIVHAGYDDKPGTKHAEFCWPGNQMFPQLDRELMFGYQLNGSLVIATNDKEVETLKELLKRGETNGVKRLRIVDKEELRTMEPCVNPNAVAALYSPDAGNVIPYEYTIALAENAVDNGVELRIRREVTKIEQEADGSFSVQMRHWEPKEYLDATKPKMNWILAAVALSSLVVVGMGAYMAMDASLDSEIRQYSAFVTYTMVVAGALAIYSTLNRKNKPPSISSSTPLTKLVDQAGLAKGTGGQRVSVADMLVGGSGSSNIVKGTTVEMESIKARYVINCAGGASDKVARMIGDDSFKIKPRLGDYLLLNRNQVRDQ